jgi:hypothetical protein
MSAEVDKDYPLGLVLPEAKDETKQVLVGETGNVAEVTVEHRSAYSELSQAARGYIRQAGELHKPIDAELIGFGVVFFYSKEDFVLRPQFFCASQTDIGEVHEQHASVGWKELGSTFQKAYGRAEPKKVKR